MPTHAEALQATLGFESHFQRIGGLRYHYLDEGRGLPVVMLHGNPTWCFMYRRLVRYLRSNYRTLVPDHVGCGLSDKPGDGEYPFTLERRVADVEEWIERIALPKPFHLVVHDWGGVIGSTYAVRHPKDIRSLTVLNTAAFRVASARDLHWSIRWCRRSRLAGILIRGCNLFSFLASHVGSRAGMSRSLRHAFRLPYNNWANRIAVHRFVQDIPLEPEHTSYPSLLETEKKLHELGELPICICWGEKDFVFDVRFLEEWKKRFPKAEIHSFPGAGHYVLEDASEEIQKIVEAFLGRN